MTATVDPDTHGEPVGRATETQVGPIIRISAIADGEADNEPWIN